MDGTWGHQWQIASVPAAVKQVFAPLFPSNRTPLHPIPICATNRLLPDAFWRRRSADGDEKA